MRLGAYIAFVASLTVVRGAIDAIRGPCESCNATLLKSVGDIIFGGLFPVHKIGDDGKCVQDRTTVRQFGFERLEAMRFAIDQINDDETLLPNITLGYEMRDTCSDADYALRQSLNFLNGDETPSLGVVGAASSGISIRVTDLLNLFFVPLISYASTSATLSDSDRYPYFFRSLPSDEFQATAMVAIAKKYGWTYVHGVHSLDAYGTAGFSSFKRKASEEGIDLGLDVGIDKDASLIEVHNALEVLEESSSGSVNSSVYQRGSVIVMFCHLDVARKVLYIVSTTPKLKSRGFTFIGSDSWGDKDEVLTYGLEDMADTARGLISVIPSQIKVESYNAHMANLNPSNYKTNEWFLHYYDSKLECVYPNCSETLSADLSYDSKVAFVLDAVNAYARALHNLLQGKCSGEILNSSCFRQRLAECQMEIETCGQEFKTSLENVTFRSESNETFSFDKNGDFINAEYDVKNLQVQNGSHSFKTVGLWIGGEGLGRLNVADIIWHDGNTPPSSVCSDPCGEGVLREAVKKPNERSETFLTCWICKRKCEVHHYLDLSGSSYGDCKKCPDNQTSNDARTGCVPLEITYLHWGDGLAIFVIILAVIGCILVVLTLIAFGLRWHTPLVMASSRELSVIMLLGMLLSYLLTFVFVAKPTDVTCGIQRFFFGVFLSIIFGALLIKTNRISRLFNRSASVQRPSCISPSSQLILTGLIVVGACAISVVWLVIANPYAVSDSSRKNVEVNLKCKHLIDYGTLVSWLYILGLIVVCIVYAYKTRKIPENFKETLFINFAAYAELIIWLAFIAVGIVTTPQQRPAFMSLAMTLTASAAWGCLFLPKLYIILLRPERNVRQPTMRRPSRGTGAEMSRHFSKGTNSLSDRQAAYAVNNSTDEGKLVLCHGA